MGFDSRRGWYPIVAGAVGVVMLFLLSTKVSTGFSSFLVLLCFFDDLVVDVEDDDDRTDLAVSDAVRGRLRPMLLLLVLF